MKNEIKNDLEVVTQCKYSVPDSNVPLFMVQMPKEDTSVFQFRKSKSFDAQLDSEPVSSIMSIENVEYLLEFMKQQTEHYPVLGFEIDTDAGVVHHQIVTESADEFILFFQLIAKYFYPICLNWKSVYNMQRLQKKREQAESKSDTENE